MAQFSPEQQQAQLHQAQLHQAQQAAEQHLHQQKVAGIAAGAAKQAVDAHAAYGDDGLKSIISEMLNNGGDPNFIQQVAQQLYHNGRPDLAQIHAEAADGW